MAGSFMFEASSDNLKDDALMTDVKAFFFLRFSSSSSIPAAELLQPCSVCFVINPQQPSLLMWRTKGTRVSICFDNQSSVCLRTLTHTPSVAALHVFAFIAAEMNAAGALGASFFSL